jgi:bacterial/archaeal transporter family-2 protein
MAAGGIAGTAQVAIMGRFGERIGAVEALAFSTLATAAITLVALVVVRQSVDGYEAALRSPAWMWLGAACGAFIVFSITVAAPRIGTTASVAIFIAFQLAASAAVDRWGLFGLERIPLDWERVVGLVLLATGAALTLKR